MADNKKLADLAREKGLDVTDDMADQDLLAMLDPMNDLPPELAAVVLEVGDKLTLCDKSIGENE